MATSSQALDCAVTASSASYLPLRIPAASHLHYRMPVALSKVLGVQAFPELRPPLSPSILRSRGPPNAKSRVSWGRVSSWVVAGGNGGVFFKKNDTKFQTKN